MSGAVATDDQHVRPSRFHRRPQAGDECRHPRDSKGLPRVGKRIRVGERIIFFLAVDFAPHCGRQLRAERVPERADGGAAVVKPLARVTRVVEVHAVDVVAGDEIAHDGVDVFSGGRQDGRRIQPFDGRRVGWPRSLCACPSRDLADVGGTVFGNLRQLLHEISRHHQPLGMTMDEVRRRDRQIGRARDQVDVHPGVHAQSGLVRARRARLRADRSSPAAVEDRRRAVRACSLKYASPRPRTCTSSVLNPWSRAVRTSVAIESGVPSDVRSTQSARISPAVVSGAACGRRGRTSGSVSNATHREPTAKRGSNSRKTHKLSEI